MTAYRPISWMVAAVAFIGICPNSWALAATNAPPQKSARPAAPTATETEESGPSSKSLPPLEDIATPAEQATLSDLVTKLEQAGSDNKAILGAADEVLARVPQPTKLRGYIQFIRGGALSAMNRDSDAIDPVEESVRLLPGYSAPLFLASNVFAYGDRPEPAADYLLRAIEADPATARTFDEYDLGNLIHRLGAVGDGRKIALLGERLLNIGWSGNDLELESQLALQAIISRLNDHDVKGAQAFVSKLIVPDDSRSILTTKAYGPIWPAVEQWAGPKLRNQWQIYLREAHDRWAANKSVEAASDYLKALSAAGHYEAIARDALPLFQNPDKVRDYDLIFSVSTVARALAHLHRWSEANDLFERALQTWPLGQDPNALNIAANYAQFLLLQGKAAEALQRMDAAIADARRWGPVVNHDGIAAMYHYRACMLHELHRDAEATVSAAEAVKSEYGMKLAELYLCLGQIEKAKSTLLAALQDPFTRDDVVNFAQPPSEPALDTDYDRRFGGAKTALRNDPELQAAVQKVGRVLDFKLSEGAPQDVP